MATTLAFLGLGRMGQAMVHRLRQAGFQLRVWDRTPGRATPGLGLEVCNTPREAATGAPFVMTSLANDEAVETVTFGPDGFLDAMSEDAVHVGASTISFSLAKVLTERHAAKHTHYIGAPVLGRPEAAERGELFVLAGGEPEVVRRSQPIFDAIARATIVADTAAQAHITKVIANLIMANTIELLGETTALGEKAGIAPEKLIDMLGRTIVGSPVFKGYGGRIARSEYEPAAFRLELGLKDVSLALAAGDQLRAPLPLASLVHDHMIEAIAKGHAQKDWAALAMIPREAAGLPHS